MTPVPRLSSRIASEFDADVRARGHEYYRSNLVRIQTGSGTSVRGTVAGAQVYDVEAWWDNGTLSLYCSCPYYEDNGPCKHLWALILTADAKGHLSAARQSRRLGTDFDVPDFEDRGSVEDFEDEEPRYYPRKPFVPPRPTTPRKPDWRQELAGLSVSAAMKSNSGEVWPAKRQLLYVVDVPSSERSGAIALELLTRDRKKGGDWSKSKDVRLTRQQISQLSEAEDREILSILTGAQQSYALGTGWYDTLSSHFQLLEPMSRMLIERMARTGRCYLRLGALDPAPAPLGWEDGDPWKFALEVGRRKNGNWGLGGALLRGAEKMDVRKPHLLAPGLIFYGGHAAALEAAEFHWIARLRKDDQIEAPDQDRDDLLGAVLAAPNRPRLQAPPELQFDELLVTPVPCLAIHGAKKSSWSPDKLRARLSFDYDGTQVNGEHSGSGVFQAAERRFLVRDAAAEAAARDGLAEAGFRFAPAYDEPDFPWELHPAKLPRAARELVRAGWRVEADGRIFRRPGSSRMSVSSGVDWFELHGEVDYGGASAKLPALLDALRRGEKMVRLDDGTYGLLPEEWLSRFGPLAGMGAAAGDHIRFRPSQAGLLDALLATQPEVDCDAAFARVREQLRSFEGLSAADQPPGFVGQLRDYQREGLGWMHFLRRFGFGGCLADDMGVGKTAQVLALLETRRQLRAGSHDANGTGEERPCGPSLVVVPRSLVFNWKAEAARFTPRLCVLDYTGITRAGSDFGNYDIVLTTYGTLRRDALLFKDIEFDYVVLDEAQAIKNAGTESAKAARLLRGRNRLALSGTPVENHLGELWSLFEFLNPGILGSAGIFKLAGDAVRNPGDDTRRMLAQALRPFILRRTKEQVARELPAKTEQTIFCELEPGQRRHYDELRQHYRNSLLKRIEAQGLAKSKIHVLEALLRLRQAACHSALIDPSRADEPSAKIDVLMEQLREVLEEGHKALVFSQFTSLLDIVRRRLKDSAVNYEYLDGATRDRQSCVERFQNDPECRLFLISLKAGGLGLNLTAAEYVFLLDPWWNPAVEAQAIDRAHRIGQERQVFAYRLIARDTVEEKVLELQSTKRDLAAAIINADNSLIRDLGREDLELLLS